MSTSLREKKKRRTHADILAAAAELVERGGYRNTTMRDIAAAADLSYQTLYNYFPSKARIGLALLGGDDARDGPPRDDADLVGALRGLAESVSERIAEGERELWSEAVVEAIRDGEKPVVRCLGPGVGVHLRELLDSARQRGQLDAYVDTARMASVIDSILTSALLDRVMDRAPEQDSTAIFGRIELVLNHYLRDVP